MATCTGHLRIGPLGTEGGHVPRSLPPRHASQTDRVGFQSRCSYKRRIHVDCHGWTLLQAQQRAKGARKVQRGADRVPRDVREGSSACRRDHEKYRHGARRAGTARRGNDQVPRGSTDIQVSQRRTARWTMLRCCQCPILHGQRAESSGRARRCTAIVRRGTLHLQIGEPACSRNGRAESACCPRGGIDPQDYGYGSYQAWGA
mmetsp:Transcript_21194/g.45982  ORF Transcript_21194/g.45982 Transcript_21194/m.45982 type:complete len:203 (+) Transcript_21194:1218-1826(+)